MPDALGWRKKFAVLVPSTNTIVEPETYLMAVPGVTAHVSRIFCPVPDLSSNDANVRFLEQIRANIQEAIDRAVTCEPDYLIMGLSAETFWGGKEGCEALKRRLKEMSGLDVATGAESCERALQALGAKRIAILSPYQANGDEQVLKFFADVGVDVKRIHGLRMHNAVSIAHVQEAAVRAAFQAVDGDDVDALVQVGTNLACVELADTAERWLGKPVIAINASTWWMALRDNGIDDKVYGCGRLLREY